jgi:2-oxo-3-hexenedioate decarboxylase
MNPNITIIAKQLDKAATEASATTQPSTLEDISLDDAYQIQSASMKYRYERGEYLVGVKMGFTSIAKMKQMGVHDMIFGRLTDSMQLSQNQKLNLKKFIHPRAEPEIAFLIKRDISQFVTIENIADYIEGVAPAIEIIDSRYENFKFSLEDVVADNCSSSGYILGNWYSVDTDIADVPIAISTNGNVQQSGSSKAILGNPFQSFVEATRLALKYGQELKKGMVILAGAATPAIHFDSGDSVNATFGHLGHIDFKVI